MANKIHFRATKQGIAACACGPSLPGNVVYKNNREKYAHIPANCVVGPDEFRATPQEQRCAHCENQFTYRMNERRKVSGKPLYKDAFTKELA